MPKYKVTIKRIETYVIDSVDAESESEAINKADSMLDNDEGKSAYYFGSDGECSWVKL
jgi:hypothetical protein